MERHNNDPHTNIEPVTCIKVMCKEVNSKPEELKILVEVQDDYKVVDIDYIEIDRVKSLFVQVEFETSNRKALPYNDSDRGYKQYYKTINIEKNGDRIPLSIEHNYEHSITSSQNGDPETNFHRTGGVIIDPRS